VSLLRSQGGRLILGVNIRVDTQDAGREWFGAVRQTPSSNFTWLSFSNAVQRQLAEDPGASSPLSLSPPYW
jgi:hypothetical protein